MPTYISNCPAGQPRHRAWAYFPTSLPSHLPTQLVGDMFPPEFGRGKMMEKSVRKPSKIIKKSMKIFEKSLKIEVRESPSGSWEGSWGHSGSQGCFRDEKQSKRDFVNPPPRDQAGDKKSQFSDLWALVFTLIFRVAVGKASGSIFQ